MPHDLPTYDFSQSARVLLWLLLGESASPFTNQQEGGSANATLPPSETSKAKKLLALIGSRVTMSELRS